MDHKVCARIDQCELIDLQLRLTNMFNNVLPQTLGYDACGRVVELGEGVTNFVVGDEVFGRTSYGGGGWAEVSSFPRMQNLLTLTFSTLLLVKRK